MCVSSELIHKVLAVEKGQRWLLIVVERGQYAKCAGCGRMEGEVVTKIHLQVYTAVAEFALKEAFLILIYGP